MNNIAKIAVLDQLQSHLTSIDEAIQAMELRQARSRYETDTWIAGCKHVLERCTMAIANLADDCQVDGRGD